MGVGVHIRSKQDDSNMALYFPNSRPKTKQNKKRRRREESSRRLGAHHMVLIILRAAPSGAIRAKSGHSFVESAFSCRGGGGELSTPAAKS